MKNTSSSYTLTFTLPLYSSHWLFKEYIVWSDYDIPCLCCILHNTIRQTENKEVLANYNVVGENFWISISKCIMKFSECTAVIFNFPICTITNRNMGNFQSYWQPNELWHQRNKYPEAEIRITPLIVTSFMFEMKVAILIYYILL